MRRRHTDDQADLFGENAGSVPARKQRGRRPAPDALSPPERKRLEEWAEDHVPWLRREALQSFESLDSLVEECLSYWQGDGGRKADWVRTIENRILVVERRRLTTLARDGHAGARMALRNPKAWRASFDDRVAATQVAKLRPNADDEDFQPTGGGEVIRMGDRSRRSGDGWT